MLIELKVGNYLSFKEEVTMNLLSTKYRDKKANSFSIGDYNFLKSAAIYGPNASGKSNFFKAIAFMRRFVLNSSKNTQVSESINVEEYRLNVSTANQPSLFEVIFLLDEIPYRYGFKVTRDKIISEWLYFAPSTKEAKLFLRENGSYQIGEKFKEGRELEEKTRENALFLSVVAQFNGRISTSIIKWFQNIGIVSGINDERHLSHTIENILDEKFKSQLKSFISIADLGIMDLVVKKQKIHFPKDLPQDLRKFILKEGGREHNTLLSKHRVFNDSNEIVGDVDFNFFESESEGTKKYVGVAGRLIENLKKGGVIFIDELDAKLHPIITRALVALFNSEHNLNSQIIFVTHDVGIMTSDYLRRDQIWFTDKDKFGASHLYSLVDYSENRRTVRNDEAIYKNYLLGKYGGVPYLGDFNEEKEIWEK